MMNSTEKKVSYQTSNSYSTLNTLTDKTKNVWLVFHGIGYLSRYFLKYFDQLNSDENYIIAPQAPSKYYLGSAYKHVGSSWLTKENTSSEIRNVMSYFDAVLQAENIPSNRTILVVGFSQGVSVAARYIATRNFQCNQLILCAGGIPKELNPDDFQFLSNKTKVSFIYGTQDEYINTTYLIDAKKRFHDLFGKRAAIITFEGKHEVPKELINKLV